MKDKNKKIVKATLPKLQDFEGNLNKRWYVEFSFRNPETGKMKRLRRAGDINKYHTLKERYLAATRLTDELTRKLKGGWNPLKKEDAIYTSVLHYAEAGKKHLPQKRVKNFTFIEALENVLNIKRSNWNEETRTFKSYQSRLRYFQEWLKEKGLIDLAPISFTNEMASEFIQHLRASKERSAEKTVHSYRTQLNQFCKELVEDEILIKNPFAKVRVKKPSAENPGRAFKKYEKERLKSHLSIHEPELLLFIKFIYYCGMRPIEVAKIKVENIDWERKIIDLRAKNTKSKRRDWVTIKDVFAEELKALILDKNLANSIYLFRPQIKRRKTVAEYYCKRARKTLQSLGIDSEDIKPLYSWRHTGAVYLYEETKDIKDVQKYLRHKDVKETDGYLHSRGIIRGDEELRKDFPEL